MDTAFNPAPETWGGQGIFGWEALRHPVKDKRACKLFTQGLFNQLKTGDDCNAGSRINLDKDWTGMMNDLLSEAVLTF